MAEQRGNEETIGEILEEQKKTENKGKAIKFIISILILLLIVACICIALLVKNTKSSNEVDIPSDESHLTEDVVDTTEDSTGEHDTVINDKRTPYKLKIDYGQAIMGDSAAKQELIVFEQNVTLPYETTKEGMFGWEIFKQKKLFIYHGVGEYRVDLAQVTIDDISVNKQTRTILIKVPKPELKVNLNLKETEFYDTNNGKLRFGEMKFTAEESNAIAIDGENQIKAVLESDEEVSQMADEYAKMQIANLYQGVVNTAIEAAYEEANDMYAVPMPYTVKVSFKKE